MKKVFESHILVEVEMLKELLDRSGIPCMIKNQQGSSLAGEVPFVEVFPELWVINDRDCDHAKELLKERPRTGGDQPEWVCAACGEKHPGNFTACWKCGRNKDCGTSS